MSLEPSNIFSDNHFCFRAHDDAIDSLAEAAKSVSSCSNFIMFRLFSHLKEACVP